MKAVIKLVIVAAIINAVCRIGFAYVQNYRFVDAVQEVAQFRGNKPDNEIHNRVFELASQYDIPVTDENLTITQQGRNTVVDGSYKRPLDLFPGFKYPWRFTINVDVISSIAAPLPR